MVSLKKESLLFSVKINGSGVQNPGGIQLALTREGESTLKDGDNHLYAGNSYYILPWGFKQAI